MAIKKLIGHIFIVIVMFLSKLLLHRHQCCRYHHRCCCRNHSSGALLIVKFSIHHILVKKKRSKIVMVQMRDNFALEVPDRSWRILPHIAPLEMIFKIAFEITSDWYLVWRSQFAKSSSSPYRHRHCHLYRYHFCFYLSTIILRYIPRPRQR